MHLLPEDHSDYSSRWHSIKSAFSRQMPEGERLSRRRTAKGERGMWQRRFWEHAIRDEQDVERHADYIHYNPVKHGHARTVMDLPHSSFHRFVREGAYPGDWAAGDEVRQLNFA